MEKTPAYTGEGKMSDIAMARGFVEQIGDHAQHRRGNLIDRVYDACASYANRFRKNNPNSNDVPSFTHRRIRSFWNQEAAIVSFSEMVWLADIAEEEKRLAERIKQERKHHAQFIAKTTRMAALLEGGNADRMGGQVQDVGSRASGVDRAGIGR